MQKSKIPFVIITMSIALLGIILLQIYWIRHDFAVKEQQFDQQVSEALNAVVDKIETRKALHFLGSNFFKYESDTNFWKAFDPSLLPLPPEPPEEPEAPDEANTPPPTPAPVMDINNLKDSVFRKMVFDVRKGLSEAIRKDPFSNSIEYADSAQHGDTWHKEEVKINTDSSNDYTEINHLRIDQQMMKQDRARIENDRVIADIDRQRVRTEQELTRMRVKVNSKMEKLNEVMNLLAVEYVQDDKNVSKIISEHELDTLLNIELKNRGISTGYNFALLKKDGLSEESSNQKTIIDPVQKAALINSNYRVNLFPNDIVSKGEYLLLDFPSRTTFVLSSMIWMLLSSAGFTITIIIVFAYTILMLMRQKKISDVKSDFINNMTHEFKTPIATIALAVDAINNPKVRDDNEKVNYYSNIIRAENKRMNRQVETILQTALFEKKDFKVNKKEIDIHQLILKTIDNIRLQVEDREGIIETHLNAENTVLRGDEVLLSTVIINLLDNANKYSPEKPQITLTTQNREKGILISVEDKGMGMSRDTMNKVFEKFYRQQSGNIHDVKGFGLGLSNVKTIVTEHGGEIKVKSELGKGSRFDVYLPLE